MDASRALEEANWMLSGGGIIILSIQSEKPWTREVDLWVPLKLPRTRPVSPACCPVWARKPGRGSYFFSYLFLGNTQVYNRVGWAAALMEQKIMCFGSRCPRPGKNELGETGQVHQLLYNWPAAKASPNDRWQNSSLCGNIFDGSARVLLSVPMSCRGAAPQLLLMLSECWQCTSDWLTDLDHLDSARMVPGRMQSGLDDWAERRTQMRQCITFTMFFVLFFSKRRRRRRRLIEIRSRFWFSLCHKVNFGVVSSDSTCCCQTPLLHLGPSMNQNCIKGPIVCHSVCI